MNVCLRVVYSPPLLCEVTDLKGKLTHLHSGSLLGLLHKWLKIVKCGVSD